MKLPSLKSLWTETQGVILRFPLQMLVTLVATVTCILLINHGGSPFEQNNLIKLLLVSNLALVLLLSADLFAEVMQLSIQKKWLMRLGCLVLCAIFYFTLNPAVYTADFYRIALLAFAFHLLVAFAPFLYRGNLLGFWEYNKVLFIRILTAGLYSHVLFGGLAIALAAVNGLFNVEIDSDVYFYLLSVVGVGFTTVFFLAGVPVDFKALNATSHVYPKGLKIFTQYVLIPLLAVYLCILLVYEAKIIINWEFPKGMVSALILGYSVFGILSLLLVYPVREQEGNGWIGLFSRFFYFMMIPLVVLLLLAVWARVSEYGITEPRYILVVLAIWLSIITCYFLFSKKDNIKIIPISLSILALLAAYGPQSAFSVSRYSQTQRLKKIMKSTDTQAMREKPAIIRYLVEEHGLTSLQSFTKTDLSALEEKITGEAELKSQHRYELSAKLTDTAFSLLKVKEVQGSIVNVVYFHNEDALNVKDYDFMLELDTYMSSASHTINGIPVELTKKENREIGVKIGNERQVLSAKALVDEINKAYDQGSLKRYKQGNGYTVPSQTMTLKLGGQQYDLQLVMTELTLDFKSDAAADYNFRGYLLIKIK